VAELAPGFDWSAFMAGAGLTKASRVVVQEKSAFPAIAAIFAKTPIDTLKAWQASISPTRPRPISPRPSTRRTTSSATRHWPGPRRSSPAGSAA
jgi:hypothetical protein